MGIPHPFPLLCPHLEIRATAFGLARAGFGSRRLLW